MQKDWAWWWGAEKSPASTTTSALPGSCQALRGAPFKLCGSSPCSNPNDSNAVEVGANSLLQSVGAGDAYPFAKGFGQLLNLNCAVMILPVFRKGVRYLHDISSQKGGPFWWIPKILPLDKNIVFHKVSLWLRVPARCL